MKMVMSYLNIEVNMKKFWVYKKNILEFKDPIEYNPIRLTAHLIDPAKYHIHKRNNEYFWYEFDGYKDILVYEFLKGKKNDNKN